MKTRFGLLALIFFGFWFGLLQPSQAVGAQELSNCARTYRVQWGDNLFRISLREGVSVWELATLNNISNINLIYAGSTLCVQPSVPDLGPPPSETLSSFDLVAEYTFTAGAEDGTTEWTLGSDLRAGRRNSYELASGDVISTTSKPENVQVSSREHTPAPILWLARNEDSDAGPFTYTLVAIGDAHPLLDLAFGFTPTLETIFPDLPSLVEIQQSLEDLEPLEPTKQPASALVDPAIADVVLRAELVTQGNTFIPLTITHIDYQYSVELASITYGNSVAFALHPDGETYFLYMIMTDDGSIGPPGTGWSQRCASWSGGGWWSRFRYFWFGC